MLDFIFNRPRLLTIAIGVGFTEHKVPLDPATLDRVLPAFESALAAATGGWSRTVGWGASVECPDGERTLFYTTFAKRKQREQVEAALAIVRHELKQGSILILDQPVNVKFLTA